MLLWEQHICLIADLFKSIAYIHYAFARLLCHWVYPQLVVKKMDSVLLYNPDTIASLSYNVAHLAGNTCFSLGWICRMHVKTVYKPYKFIPYSCFRILRSVLILTCHVYQHVFHSWLLIRSSYKFVCVSKTCCLLCVSYPRFYYPIKVWWNTNCETLRSS